MKFGKRREKSILERLTLLDFMLAFVLTLGMITVVYPFWNSVLVSIVPAEDILMNPAMIFPKRVSLAAYEYVFTESLIPRGFLNSAVISVAHTFLAVSMSVIAGYVFTKKFPGQKAFYVFLILPSLLPGGLIPNYILIQKLHLINNPFAIILPGAFVWSSGLYMARYFRSVPVELEEAAKIDGASEVRIVCRIILPLITPFIAVACLNTFVQQWNSWYNGMLYMRSAEKMPLATILRDMQQTAKNILTLDGMTEQANQKAMIHSESIQMACVMTATIPIMLLYPYAQRFFIGGLTSGAVKG